MRSVLFTLVLVVLLSIAHAARDGRGRNSEEDQAELSEGSERERSNQRFIRLFNRLENTKGRINNLIRTIEGIIDNFYNKTFEGLEEDHLRFLEGFQEVAQNESNSDSTLLPYPLTGNSTARPSTQESIGFTTTAEVEPTNTGTVPLE